MTYVQRLTNDGSHTLEHLELGDVFHSVHGAVTESRFIYISQGLDWFFTQCFLSARTHLDACDNRVVPDRSSDCIRILEVGFGTGLNVLLTALWAYHHRVPVYLETIDAFPLDSQVFSGLNYPVLLNDVHAEPFYRIIYESPWDQLIGVHEYFSMVKRHQRVQTFLNQSGIFDRDCEGASLFDVIFYDAFSAKYQPEMWTEELFKVLRRYLSDRGIAVTYCSAGWFKRRLHALNYAVTVLPGPPGKREMLRFSKFPTVMTKM